jgi:Pyruvate/2-oxoacid:ferredoxin oxidoreductase delta subunit
MKYLLYILVSVLNAEKIIKNINIPACRNCIYYKPETYNSDFATSYNKCTKFGNKDIVTDKISYDFAESCRKDQSKCGIDAIYFEREPNINMKVLKHTVISNLSNIVLFSYLFLIVLIIISSLVQ